MVEAHKASTETTHLYATASNIVTRLSSKIRIFAAVLYWTKHAARDGDHHGLGFT